MGADSGLMRILARLPYGLFAFAIAGWFGWQYWQFNHADDSELLQKRASIGEIRAEIAGAQKRVEEVDRFKRSLEGRRQHLAALKSELEARKAAVPEELDPVEFTRMVSREAEDVGLRVVSLQPEGREKREYYQVHPFTLSFTGVYLQVYKFLERISSVPKIVRVDEFSMRPTGANTSKYVPIQGTMRLTVYSYLQSEADAVKTSGAAGPGPSSETGGSGEGGQ